MRSARFASIILIAVLVLSACNLPSAAEPTEDINAASTIAAQTVQAQLTLQAAFASPTSPIILPSNTPPVVPTVPLVTSVPPSVIAISPTSNCNAAQFIADVTIPDGTVMTPNQAFTKTWRLKNIGTCSWTSAYAVVFSSGSAMNGPATQALTGNVNPGQTLDISVNFTAPSTPGDYTAYYKLRDASGVLFFNFYVQIKVQTSGGSGGSGGPFAVIHVTYTTTTWSDAGHTNCPKVIAHIATNGPGTVTYHWTWSDGGSTPTKTLVFSAAGTQDIEETWAVGSVNAGTSHWMGIYIDSPNHQDFGHANVDVCTSP